MHEITNGQPQQLRHGILSLILWIDGLFKSYCRSEGYRFEGIVYAGIIEHLVRPD